MREYFCGWYYRCQGDDGTLAVIPSFHKTKKGAFCSIQLITDTHAFHARFPYDALRQEVDHIAIGNNRFGADGLSLNLHTPQLSAVGELHLGPLSPIKYDIMGPFRYVPFMQCRHSVYSMRHSVDGALCVNGMPYRFCRGAGYLEGDRGHSFPKEYAWTQCNLPEGAIMLSVADIPFGGLHFTGVIGVVLLHGKEYRLATYLGAKAVKIKDGEIIVRQGRLRLTVKQLGPMGHPLDAPVGGDMTRTIHEHPACKVYYRFSDGDTTLLNIEAPDAAFEYEY